jgi:uncharacterized membrane protein YjgN (DUF898 family)
MLMMPLVLWLMIHLKSRLARLGLVLGVFLIDIFQVAMRWHSSVSDGRNWWVPVALLAIFILSLGIEQMQSRRFLAFAWPQSHDR